jgi:hypothetical protein
VECDDHARQALEIASQLLDFANTDRAGCDHDGCLLLDGIVRDCALRIRQEALRLELALDGERHRESLARR